MSKNHIKGNKYDHVSYSIPFILNSTSREGDDGDGEIKEVKIPLKIYPKEEGDSKLLNTTYLIVRAIEHWDDNIELVLDNFARINDNIMYAVKNQWEGQG